MNPWRDAAPDEPAGRVVVVSGPPQSGRSTVLRQAADDLRRSGFRVVRREARDGSLQSVAGSGSGEHVVQGAKVLAAALQVAGAGAVGNLIALGAEIATTRHLVDSLDPDRLPSDPYVHVVRVEQAVRERAEQRAAGHRRRRRGQARHAGGVVGRPVRHDAAATGRPTSRCSWSSASSGPPRPGRTALQVIDSKLVPAGLAEEIRVPPLDPRRITRALGPIDDALLGQLRSLVQARPAWLDDLWRGWRADDVVVQRDGRWAVAPDARSRARTSLHAWVDVALRKGARDGDAYWRAKEILETAALEGQRFTVEAVAAVLGEDVEDLIDWIDDHLAGPDGPSLLQEDGFVERADGVEPPELRCYRFRSAMVAGVLRQEVLAGTNGKERARRYAHAMAGAYRWSAVSASAWTISRLATAAGDEELAETIWRRANRLEGVEAAARLARFLVEHTDVRSAMGPELVAVVDRLNGLLWLFLGRSNAAEVGTVAEATVRMARALPSFDGADLLVEALRILGAAAVRDGRIDDGLAALAEAAATSARGDNPVRTADLYSLLANVEWVFAADDEQRAAARRHNVAAVEHARCGSGREASVMLAKCLAESTLSADDPAQRVRALGEAAGILLDTGSYRGEVANLVVVCLLLFRAADLARSDGARRTEERFRTAGVQCRTEAFLGADDLSELSALRRRLGDRDGAVYAAAQSLRLVQELNAPLEGAALLRLGYCARDGGKSADVFALLAAARIGEGNQRTVGFVEDLHRDFGDVLARLDDASVAGIEHDYRADRGESLLREVFGVDVAEIDALNERLGDAGEDELRGFLLDVQQYCTRDESTT